MRKSGRLKFSDEKYLRGREKLQPFKLKMLELIKGETGGRILDIGCGSGVISEILHKSGFEVIGFDISFVALSEYKKLGFDGLISNAEYSLPFKKNVFDAVWMSEVIEHIVDFQALLMETARVLKPGGKLYLTTPNSIFYGYRLMYLLGKCPTELQHPFHLRYFSPKFLVKILNRNGFEIEKQLGQNVYMIIPMSLIRKIEKFWQNPAAVAEKFFLRVGFKKMDGLIHGDKIIYFKFSSCLCSFFSNVIMIVARSK
jgi:2-polyprenyl-3-methyl-5-hydroxy-6-metoxy-1,4-benzoquinol methylase